MQIEYKKPIGPKKTIKGKIISRSIVGTENIIKEAQDLKEERER